MGLRVDCQEAVYPHKMQTLQDTEIYMYFCATNNWIEVPILQSMKQKQFLN